MVDVEDILYVCVDREQEEPKRRERKRRAPSNSDDSAIEV